MEPAAFEIIRRKGSTSWAIGLATAEIVEAVLRSREQILTVSGRTHGVDGLPDVSLMPPGCRAECSRSRDWCRPCQPAAAMIGLDTNVLARPGAQALPRMPGPSAR